MVQSIGSRVQQLIETSQVAIAATAVAPHESIVAKYPVSSFSNATIRAEVLLDTLDDNKSLLIEIM